MTYSDIALLTMHPTLLIGPSDWQRARMPKAEFLRRIEELWQRCPDASSALVYGNPRHHAELAYLTNFVPKLEAAVALLSRSDAPRLFVGGGPNMLGAARPLTWIENLGPLKELESFDTSDCVLIGGGYLPTVLRQTVGDIPEATARLWAQMRRKSPAELAAIREACAILNAAMTTIAKSKRAGAGVTTAILAGERVANERGAQDVRTLFGVNGGRTLQPFDMPMERAVDSLQVYVAIRQFNYWAEGFALFSERPCFAAEKAEALLDAMIPIMKPGSSASAVANLIASQRAPYECHPVTSGMTANSIGLTLDEPPFTDVGASFEAGEVYTLRIGVTNGTDQHAIASAMIALQPDGGELLWRSASSNNQTN